LILLGLSLERHITEHFLSQKLRLPQIYHRYL